MKNINRIWLLIIGTLLFVISYNLDNRVNLLFKSLKFQLLDAVFGLITNFNLVILAMAVIPSIIFYRNKKKPVYLLWLTFLVSVILAFVIKLIVLRQRPLEALAYQIKPLTYPLINILVYSFPSMHAMVAFSLLPVIIKYLPKQKFFWIIFAFLVAFSRVYFRLHFLSDVVFGGFLGYFIGIFLLEMHEKGKLWKK
ncbi:phosphatase PAP2 family protein [Candidatus Woesearchaeota archaeon]|nr:phosphatase PAP2 family protein [Candidatus Woesearchaeota archaeon]